MVEHFASSYREARDKFLDAARDNAAVIEHHPHPGVGPSGETLACEIARFGPADAPSRLFIGSATHGIEGYCGSGCQVGLMRADVITAPPPGVAVYLVHAHNPHGFAWGRRVTEEGVDLNRNFIDFGEPLPEASGYAALAPHLLPADWGGPAHAAADAALAAWRAAHGAAAFQAALTTGQHHHPAGLFYGGTAPTWARRTLEAIWARHAAQARRLAWIDLHTGLGPQGYGEPIFPGAPGSLDHDRALAWFGPDVTCPAAGTSSSAPVRGNLYTGLRRALPDLALGYVALEFGTVPLAQMLEALRGDHWIHAQGDLTAPPGPRLKAAIRAAFYVETDDWKRAVSARCAEITRAALAALAA